MLKAESLKLGRVGFERPVAAHIVKKSVLKYRVNALMTDSKLRTAATNDNNSDRDADYVKITRLSENAYAVSINLVIKFGVSISKVANDVIAEIRKDLKDYLNFEPQEVIVRVVGVKSKSKPVIRRDIVIKG